MSSESYREECSAAAAMYALGALPEDEAQRFQQRLASGCPLCMAEYAACCNITDLLAMSESVQPSVALRARLLASVQAEQPAPPEMTIVRQNDSPWQRTPFKGVKIRALLGERTVLVRMEAGTVYPAHEHQQDEQCYVLEGSVTDSQGITVWAGDFVCMAAGSTHQPIHTDGGCVLLIAHTD